MSEQINDKLSLVEIIQKFADVNGLSIEEAERLIGTTTEEETLKKIEEYTLQRIKNNMPRPMNREQRRAMAKQQKRAKKAIKNTAETVTDFSKKINYINLIQRLRELNEKKENENYDEIS